MSRETLSDSGLLLRSELGVVPHLALRLGCDEACLHHRLFALRKTPHHLHEPAAGRGGRVHGFGQAAKARLRDRS
jgi:hypothetical protein